MQDKLRNFLQEDLLERYLLEQTSTLENEKVERYLSLYPEVRREYEALQEGFEGFLNTYKKTAPSSLRGDVLDKIKAEQKAKHPYRKVAMWSIAACLVMVFGLVVMFQKYQDLEEANLLAQQEIRIMQRDMDDRLADLRNQYILKNNPNTKMFKIKGNQKAKDLKAVAYINPVKKLSYINMENLPQLPENKCYQMWTTVNGELVNLGVIDQKEDPNKLLSLPYSDQGVSYITIEPEGGNNIPTQENIVANFKH